MNDTNAGRRLELAVESIIRPKKNTPGLGVSKRTGKPFLYKRYKLRKAEDDLRKEIWVACRLAEWKTSIRGIKMTILFRKTRADITNLISMIADAAQGEGLIYKNDAQIADIHARWSESLSLPTTAVVTVEEL